MDNQYKIAKPKTEDHQILSEITLVSKAFWGYTTQQLENWNDELFMSAEYIAENKVYCLKVKNEIIGYYSYFQLKENEIKLDRLFIIPDFIGKGFGAVLMDDFLKNCKKRNAQKIFLEADPNAEDFYKKFGFTTYNLKQSSLPNRSLPEMILELS